MSQKYQFVEVFTSIGPNFFVAVPEEVEDVDAYLDDYLYNVDSWGKGSLQELVGGCCHYIGVTYSFDEDKPLFGPYSTEEDALAAMREMANKEYQSDIENGFESQMLDNGREVTLLNHRRATGEEDTTTFFVCELRR